MPQRRSLSGDYRSQAQTDTLLVIVCPHLHPGQKNKKKPAGRKERLMKTLSYVVGDRGTVAACHRLQEER